MKERPIIFSAPTVRAILSGAKTQTRRVVKRYSADCIGWFDDGDGLWAQRFIDPSSGSPYLKSWRDRCPYGRPGDRLWVREKWRIGAWDEDRGAVAIDYFDGPRREWIEVPGPTLDGELFNRLWQQSTDDARAAGLTPDDDGRYQWAPGESPCRWRLSIHMPRWASRITLEITDVRVERLQDISIHDAMKEGVVETNENLRGLGPCLEWCYAYEDLWRSINGPESWAANPWVWVIEFKKLEQQEAA
jgi:hypothetical protein